MQEYHFNNLKEFLTGWQDNDKYFEMLKLMSQLSRLFSESEIPYLDYRLAENLFCKYFNALNDTRSCTAYDARISKVGIGIKTFILSEKNQSVEKIAEFNKLKKTLEGLKGIDLARKIGEYRNDRMQFANNTYDVSETTYHIVGRKEGLLKIFNCPYEEINVQDIRLIKDDATSISFDDGQNEFIFNKSKSVLMKRFIAPSIGYKDVEVEILSDPLTLMEEFLMQYNRGVSTSKKRIKGIDYVVLPLYSTRTNNVPEKSGLNQWNAAGRKRDEDEVYISVPIRIHYLYPNFFPKRDTPFVLYLPNGEEMSAKICQDNGKALMSNPNKALGEWILRKILKKKPLELVTMDDLNRYGFDSVCVENLHSVNKEGLNEYRISFTEFQESFNEFLRDY